MSNETYRQFDPWRPSPVKEISRRQIVRRIISMSITSPMSRIKSVRLNATLFRRTMATLWLCWPSPMMA